MAEVIEHQRTGLLFAPGDPQALANEVTWARANPEKMTAMGLEARRVFEAKYTAEHNYQQLMTIYRDTLAKSGTGRPDALWHQSANPSPLAGR